MRYLALAADYDGTLARHGRVEDATVRALERLRASGRKLILVTGRELDDLLAIFPAIAICDLVVAENGGVLFDPATKTAEPLAPAPPGPFVDQLRARGVTPLAVGRTIVATCTPNEIVVLEVIRDLGLELHVVFNKGAVMVLPAGITKASGLAAALDRLRLSPRNVVAVGDAENDHSMLSFAEYAAAVGNAVPMLKEAADLVLANDNGEGVSELVDGLVAHDLTATPLSPRRRTIPLGHNDSGEEITIPPAGVNLLVAGSSGSGKSVLAIGVLERLAARGYQFCVIDPEGDYEVFPRVILLGGPNRAPAVPEILTALEKPAANVVVSLVGLRLQDRPAFFAALLPRLQELRVQTGRPHWILVDETHHLLPVDWQPAPTVLAQELTGMIYVTVHPGSVSPAVLATVSVVAALGEDPEETLREFARAVGHSSRRLAGNAFKPGEALLWFVKTDARPFTLRIAPGESERTRHRRKYAEGSLPPDRSFYFRGPDERLNLRAQNLILFSQIAEGVDDTTWLHHLRQGDYSRWMRNSIKDEELAAEVQAIEEQHAGSATASRRRIRAAIESRYTLPAEHPIP
jgi:hydroxymethylpyrimidine pyrophosphatase-like HAD family hydrolase